MRARPQIQQAIRTHLADALVITVAHRLQTVIDYDRICVMRDGEIVEMGAPLELLHRDGPFREMATQTGDFDNLLERAQEAAPH